MKGDDDLMAALLPFAIAIEELGETRSLDEAFVWEPNDIADKPLVTFGALRAARAAFEARAPGLLATKFWREKTGSGS